MPGFISLHIQHKTNLYTRRSIPERDWDQSGVLIPRGECGKSLKSVEVPTLKKGNSAYIEFDLFTVGLLP